MNQQQYRALTGWARRNPARQQVMTGLCRLLPYSLFFFYAAASLCLIAHFARTGTMNLLQFSFWAVPAAGLILVSLIRKALNLPRPSARKRLLLPQPPHRFLLPDCVRAVLADLSGAVPAPAVHPGTVLRCPHRHLPRDCGGPFSPRRAGGDAVWHPVLGRWVRGGFRAFFNAAAFGLRERSRPVTGLLLFFLILSAPFFTDS